MNPHASKRQVDFQIIAQWVGEGDHVLDLGCGRGVLLEYLKQTKRINGVGVDLDFDKVLGCVKRGVTVYQGDANKVLANFPDGAFDRVIFSRTVEHLEDPDAALTESLRVGKRVTVGFVNHGFWLNRISVLARGRCPINEVFPKPWYSRLPANSFSIAEFEDFCEKKKIVIKNRVHLSGDWRRPCSLFPNILCGYAIYDLASSD
jgi:methionine biosynthesis protein MetW